MYQGMFRVYLAWDKTEFPDVDSVHVRGRVGDIVCLRYDRALGRDSDSVFNTARKRQRPCVSGYKRMAHSRISVLAGTC